MGKEVRELIFELDKKIQFLMDDAVARQACGHRPTFSSFASKTQVDRSQLAVGIGNPEGKPKDGQLPPDHKLSDKNSGRIASACGFDAGWCEWKTGTEEAFKKKYHEHRRNLQKRRTDVPLARGPRLEPCPSKIKGLASIDIDGYQFGPGTTAIEIVVSCGMPPILGRYTTIQRALVELDCGAAVLTQDSYRGWLKQPQRSETGSEGSVNVKYGGGDRGKPIWRLAAATASIGNLTLEPGFAALEGLAPGDDVTVQLGTWLMDIQEADGCPSAGGFIDGIALVTPDGTELPLAVEGLPALKRNVIACMRKTLLPDDNGYVVVASHKLHVVEDVRDD